jgi:hypothetical protein
MSAKSKSPESKLLTSKMGAKDALKESSKEAYPHTSKIQFVGVGASENGDRFLRRRIRDQEALVSVAKLISNPNDEFVRLQRAGVVLLKRGPRDEFLDRVQIEADKTPTFRVATQPGFLGDEFFFPDGPARKGNSNNAFYPDESHLDTFRKFRQAGTLAGWNELIGLARGNSRLMLGYAMTCSGLFAGRLGSSPLGFNSSAPLVSAKLRPRGSFRRFGAGIRLLRRASALGPAGR